MATGAAIGIGIMAGASVAGTVVSAKQNKAQMQIQQQSFQQQSEELERQRQKEIERQRRENAQLMNSVSALTNTAFSGASAPTLSNDKYGDLG